MEAATDKQIEQMARFWRETPDAPAKRLMTAPLLKKDFLSLIAAIDALKVRKEDECADPVWKTMDSAPTESGIEVIAARFVRYDELTSMCEKSPFISFWMQTRRKFYGEPTHWLCRIPAEFQRVQP